MPNLSKAAEAATPERTKKAHRPKAVENAVKLLSHKLSEMVERRKRIAASTVGVYALRLKDGRFGLPYFAPTDKMALEVCKELLPLSDCYCLGSYCCLDGKLVSSRPRLVLDNKVS